MKQLVPHNNSTEIALDLKDKLRQTESLNRGWPDSPYLFVSERGGPMTASNVRKRVARAGQSARLPFPTHPHMRRHACGYKLANDGDDTRALQHYELEPSFSFRHFFSSAGTL